MKDYELIRRRYYRGWFAIDLASTFPFDVISLAAENSPVLSRLKVTVTTNTTNTTTTTTNNNNTNDDNNTSILAYFYLRICS